MPAEDPLQEAAELSLFHDHPDPMWVRDLESLRFLEVNEAAIQRYGYDRDTFLAMRSVDIRPPEDRAAFEDEIAKASAGLDNHGIWRHLTKSGEMLFVDVRARTIAFRGRPARLVVCRDVTATVAMRRELDTALANERASRAAAEAAAERYRRLFDSIPGKVLVLRPPDFVIVAASDAYLEATMTTRETIVGRQVFAVFPDDPADPAADGVRNFRASLERTLATGKTDVLEVQRYPVRRPAARGGGFEERFWSPVNTPIQGTDGKIAFVVHRVVDVTDLVRAGGGGAGRPLPPTADPGLHPELDIVLRVHELKRAYAALERRDAMLRNALRINKVGTWEQDLATMRLQGSEQVYAMFGADPAAFPNTQEAFLALVHPDDRDRVERDQAAAMASGRPFEMVYRTVKPDGAVRTFRESAEVVRVEGRDVAVGMVQDVTDFLAAQAEQQSLAQRLHDTLERISDAFFLLDRDWCFGFVNSEAERVLGRSREAMLGRSVWEIFPEAEGSLFERHYRHAVATGESAVFEADYAPLGKWFDVRAYATGDGLAVYFQDVTERRQREEQLRSSEERFRLVAQATDDVVRDCDLRADRVWWNGALTTILGHDPARLATGARAWQDHVHPDDRNRVAGHFAAAISGDAGRWELEYRFLRGDGSVARIVDRGFVMRDEAGAAVRLVASMVDVTKRRELDERLHHAQKLEAVGYLTGGIAHDFNNLLTIILGNAELLEDALADPSLRDLARLTVGAAERGAELTNRLLAFARRQTLQPRAVPLDELVGGMQGMLRRTLPESIELELSAELGLWPALVDPGQLEAALLNLAINARDAMPKGGRLTITLDNAPLAPGATADWAEGEGGPYVRVAVTDTGTGMAPKVAARAFDPFFTTKEVGQGSGLGLPMVYGFVTQSGGRVRLESEVDLGTTVELYLPRAEAAVTAATNDAEDPLTGGPEHVLVVEDDDLVRHHVTAQLRGLGYRVSEAATGRTALELLEQRRDVDLLFTDIVMPGGMNGTELAREAQHRHPSLKVLFTSGYSDNAIAQYGDLATEVALLHKPYRRQELATKLRQVLDGG